MDDDTTDNNNGSEPLNNNDTNEEEGVPMNDINDIGVQHDASAAVAAASNNNSQGAPSIQNNAQDDAPSLSNNNNNTANNNNNNNNNTVDNNNNNHVTFSTNNDNSPSTQSATHATVNNSNNQIIRQQSTNHQQNDQNSIHPELPFLITHWLSRYTASSTSTTSANGNSYTNREKERALQTIQNQAIILANAFETLGEFGTSSFTQQLSTTAITTSGRSMGAAGVEGSVEGSRVEGTRSTTYSDLKRKYSPLLQIGNGISSVSNARGSISKVGGNQSERGTSLLDKLVSSSSTTSTPLSEEIHLPWSLLLSAYENSIPSEREMSNAATLASSLGTSGLMSILPNGNVLRRLSSSPGGNSSPIRERKRGAFSGAGRRLGEEESSGAVVQIERSSVPLRELSVIQTMSAAQASRKQLALRIQIHTKRQELESTLTTLQTSIEKETVAKGTKRKTEVERLQDHEAEMNNLHRIISQLQVRSNELGTRYVNDMSMIGLSVSESTSLYENAKIVQGEYSEASKIHGVHSPSLRQVLLGTNQFVQRRNNLGYGAMAHLPGKNNLINSAICTRQYQSHPRVVSPSSLSSSNSSTTTLSILKSKLSHSITISSHLIYPVYCLKFDKTGRYFVTGSDDQTVKIFYLGASSSDDSDQQHAIGSNGGTVDLTVESSRHTKTKKKFNYGANMRGAVLVCTLNGHAGVVTDIDVSSDNALLATSSADGDVRVWKLEDGSPVAILRGHKDGANMVSWSTLTPYRLVTCGEDGLARMWDIKKAALKKCGQYYSWLKQEGDDIDNEEDDMEAEDCSPALNMNPLPPPPSPIQQDGDPQVAEAVAGPVVGGVDVGAAPAPDAQGIINANAAHIGFGQHYGEFQANNRIDKGVELVAQLQHGSVLHESDRLTRTSGKPVKVMCIARCPIGGHFATGSDDGHGRVWADDDDWQVENLDNEFSEFDIEDRRLTRQGGKLKTHPGNAPSTERLLATLREHNNPVTDLLYSGAGDRIMTASMRDGNVCIWSGFYHSSSHSRFSNLGQVIIRLSAVSGGGPSTANVHCDGVAWTCDDSKVITSQSSPTKEPNSADIIPFSHMIYVWDSHTGKCLLGLMSSHSRLCSALAPHPELPSVIASAGSDGVVNVWDLDRGDCFYTHANDLLHGPVEPATNRGKRCGYLEVQFSPNGLQLVLSDEGGRITVLDTPSTNVGNLDDKLTSWSLSTPTWMKEQYFANDYYELLYDSNGYCIERGSAQPPHKSPGGVRCTHEGVPYPEEMREIYQELKGPLPLPHKDARWHRDNMRSQRVEVRFESGASSKGKRIQVKSPDFTQRCLTTPIINKAGKLVQHERKNLSLAASSSRGPVSGSTNRNSNTSSNRRSSSVVWRTDEPEDDFDDEESDDEEYVGNGRTLEESSDEEVIEVDGRRSSRRRSSSRGRQGQRGRGNRRRRRGESYDSDDSQTLRPARSSSRTSSRPAAHDAYMELDSDDDDIEEIISNTTEPSGKFEADWTVANHIFKMPRYKGEDLRRAWVSRISPPKNQRNYCPQVGDSVVYIPRAHSATLKKFPISGYSPPWAAWPTAYPWPVVRCKVTHVRYRFPYDMYYNSRSRDDKLLGVAAIFTLEITGVPTQESGRTLPWPAPSFVSPVAIRTRSVGSIKFEVTVFESNEEEFLVPDYQYLWRVKELEKAIEANDGTVDGISVSVCYPNDRTDREDADHLEFDAQLVNIAETSNDEFHLIDSGHNALTLQWHVEGGSEVTDDVSWLSVWEINVKNPSRPVPSAPSLDQSTMTVIRSALNTIETLDNDVKTWYFDQPDVSRYTDYFEMIEVPMYLSLILKRLRSNYYTNKLSVLADIELIEQNCYKYNENNNDMHDLACEMYDKFQSLMNAVEEPTVDDKESSDDVSVNHEAANQPSSRAQRAARASRSRTTGTDSIGRDYNEESVDHQEIAPRRTRRAAASQRTSQPESPPESPSARRTSSRARSVRSKPTYTEKDSDDGEEEESSDEDEIEEEEEESSGGEASEDDQAEDNRKGGRLPPRGRSRRSKPSYADVGSSGAEESSEEDEVSSEEEVVVTKKRKRGGGRQSTSTTAAAEPRKKRSRTVNYPELPRWEHVTRRQIHRVGTAILVELRELDTFGFFTIPVVEAFPEVADEYSQVVEDPMDFRTIEEERLSTYGHISELQDDLILVFRNCCIFNENNPEYYNYALDIWQRLNDVFDDVVKNNYK